MEYKGNHFFFKYQNFLTFKDVKKLAKPTLLYLIVRKSIS